GIGLRNTLRHVISICGIVQASLLKMSAIPLIEIFYFTRSDVGNSVNRLSILLICDVKTTETAMTCFSSITRRHENASFFLMFLVRDAYNFTFQLTDRMDAKADEFSFIGADIFTGIFACIAFFCAVWYIRMYSGIQYESLCFQSTNNSLGIVFTIYYFSILAQQIAKGFFALCYCRLGTFLVVVIFFLIYLLVGLYIILTNLSSSDNVLGPQGYEYKNLGVCAED
ncbi:hypothetical protein ACJX0J_035141, partial [Zea mays]